MTKFEFPILEGHRRGSLDALTIKVTGTQLKEFVVALNELKLAKRDEVRLLQTAEPALSVRKRRRVPVPHKAAPEFVALTTFKPDRDTWSTLVRVPGGYTLTLDDLDLYELRRHYSIWLKNGVPERPGEELRTLFEGREIEVWFTQDAPRDALTSVPTTGEVWIDPLEDKPKE